jgi:hypothetical protein
MRNGTLAGSEPVKTDYMEIDEQEKKPASKSTSLISEFQHESLSRLSLSSLSMVL